MRRIEQYIVANLHYSGKYYMSEENKAITRRILSIFSGEDLSAVDEVIAEDYVDHNPFPGQAPGREGVKQIITDMRASFPDLKVTQEDQIAE